MALYQDVRNPETPTEEVEAEPIFNDDRALSWEAPEYIYRKKNPDWYWILGIVSIALVVIAFLLNNILFAIFVILSGFVIALYGSRKPEILRFHADHRGIQMKRLFYPYQTLNAFWVDETNEEETLLLLIPKKKTSPDIIMPLGDLEPDRLRDFLERYLPEEYTERPWTQQLMDRLHF